jgi:hypothetical protein
MITCPTQGCDGVLRQVAGQTSAGDAPIVSGPHGAEYVRCPKCQKLIVWPTPEAAGEAGYITPARQSARQ